ncbi:putative Vacuolar-sorting protein 54; of GARP complex [Paratrimastix pyriformis]|uniref:Vacuolar-sorting protein 54 n=1 Tax=Paratrimastix pyriformis TaxID=342808 RepID=A0ABQ8URH0_9EUKA|nr:putative Vacuolar-sorting protein 54; of GARP complex [Paratrimastix pyriformis]
MNASPQNSAGKANLALFLPSQCAQRTKESKKQRVLKISYAPSASASTPPMAVAVEQPVPPSKQSQLYSSLRDAPRSSDLNITLLPERDAQGQVIEEGVFLKRGQIATLKTRAPEDPDLLKPLVDVTPVPPIPPSAPSIDLPLSAYPPASPASRPNTPASARSVRSMRASLAPREAAPAPFGNLAGELFPEVDKLRQSHLHVHPLHPSPFDEPPGANNASVLEAAAAAAGDMRFSSSSLAPPATLLLDRNSPADAAERDAWSRPLSSQAQAHRVTAEQRFAAIGHRHMERNRTRHSAGGPHSASPSPSTSTASVGEEDLVATAPPAAADEGVSSSLTPAPTPTPTPIPTPTPTPTPLASSFVGGPGAPAPLAPEEVSATIAQVRASTPVPPLSTGGTSVGGSQTTGASQALEGSEECGQPPPGAEVQLRTVPLPRHPHFTPPQHAPRHRRLRASQLQLQLPPDPPGRSGAPAPSLAAMRRASSPAIALARSRRGSICRAVAPPSAPTPTPAAAETPTLAPSFPRTPDPAAAPAASVVPGEEADEDAAAGPSSASPPAQARASSALGLLPAGWRNQSPLRNSDLAAHDEGQAPPSMRTSVIGPSPAGDSLTPQIDRQPGPPGTPPPPPPPPMVAFHIVRPGTAPPGRSRAAPPLLLPPKPAVPLSPSPSLNPPSLAAAPPSSRAAAAAAGLGAEAASPLPPSPAAAPSEPLLPPPVRPAGTVSGPSTGQRTPASTPRPNTARPTAGQPPVALTPRSARSQPTARLAGPGPDSARRMPEGPPDGAAPLLWTTPRSARSGAAPSTAPSAEPTQAAPPPPPPPADAGLPGPAYPAVPPREGEALGRGDEEGPSESESEGAGEPAAPNEGLAQPAAPGPPHRPPCILVGRSFGRAPLELMPLTPTPEEPPSALALSARATPRTPTTARSGAQQLAVSTLMPAPGGGLPLTAGYPILHPGRSAPPTPPASPHPPPPPATPRSLIHTPRPPHGRAVAPVAPTPPLHLHARPRTAPPAEEAAPLTPGDRFAAMAQALKSAIAEATQMAERRRLLQQQQPPPPLYLSEPPSPATARTAPSTPTPPASLSSVPQVAAPLSVAADMTWGSEAGGPAALPRPESRAWAKRPPLDVSGLIHFFVPPPPPVMTPLQIATTMRASRTRPARSVSPPLARTLQAEGRPPNPRRLERASTSLAARPRGLSQTSRCGFSAARLSMQKDEYDEEFRKLLEATEGEFTEKKIEEIIKKKDAELDEVSATLSKRVMDSYSAFVAAMSKIQEVEHDLTMSTVLVKNSRRSLASADNEIAKKSFDITKKSQYRSSLQEMLNVLEKLRNLLNLKERVGALIDAGQFVEAVDVIAKCQELEPTWSQFTFLKGFGATLRDNAQRVVVRLNSALNECCVTHKPELLERVLAGYHRFGQLPAHLFELLGLPSAPPPGGPATAASAAASAATPSGGSAGPFAAHSLSAALGAVTQVSPPRPAPPAPFASPIARQDLRQGAQLLGHLVQHMQSAFLSSLHQAALTSLRAFYKERSIPTGALKDKSDLRELSGCAPDHLVQPCLGAFFDKLVEFMKNYHRTNVWLMQHGRRRDRAPTPTPPVVSWAPDLNLGVPGCWCLSRAWDFSGDLAEVASRWRPVLWEYIQRKAATVLAGANLNIFKLDKFCMLLTTINRFTRTGELFALTASPTLQRAIKALMHSFYVNFHADRLTILKNLVEAEQWNPFPRRFNPEEALNSRPAALSALSQPDPPLTPDDVEGKWGSFEALCAPGVSPPAAGSPTPPAAPPAAPPGVPSGPAPILTSTAHELLKFTVAYIHLMETLRPIAAEAMFGLTQLLRMYTHAVAVLFAVPPSFWVAGSPMAGGGKETPFDKLLSAAADSILAATNSGPSSSPTVPGLFGLGAAPADAYATGAPAAFTPPELPPGIPPCLPYQLLFPARMAQALGQIHVRLAQPHLYGPTAAIASAGPTGSAEEGALPAQVSPAEMQPMLPTLATTQRQWSIVERVVGAESLEYICQVVQSLRRCLQALCPPGESHLMEVLMGEVRLGQDLRVVRPRPMPSLTAALALALALALNLRPNHVVYRTLTSTLISLEGTLAAMNTVKQSAYVDGLLREFQAFAARMAAVEDAAAAPARIIIPHHPRQVGEARDPEAIRYPVVTLEVRRLLWHIAIEAANEVLVEGYSRVKKCTDDGRAQMKFDLAVLQDGLNGTAPVDVRPIPKLTLAEQYVNTLRTVELAPALMDWCRTHPSTSRAADKLKKKQLQELAANIEQTMPLVGIHPSAHGIFSRTLLCGRTPGRHARPHHHRGCAVPGRLSHAQARSGAEHYF